jgi:hypothetical protein
VIAEKKAVAKLVKPVLSGELGEGSQGDAVKYLQAKLGVSVTGVYDEATKIATIAFQKKHKEITKPDGVVGQLSWRLLG